MWLECGSAGWKDPVCNGEPMFGASIISAAYRVVKSVSPRYTGEVVP